MKAEKRNFLSFMDYFPRVCSVEGIVCLVCMGECMAAFSRIHKGSSWAGNGKILKNEKTTDAEERLHKNGT
jgi:hypothetical protein